MRLTSLLASGPLVAAITPGPGDKVIECDVAVLGGGASGAHAAVRLRDDFGKRVVVVEKEDILVSPVLHCPKHTRSLVILTRGRFQGGHVATYIDPDSGIPYNHGVNSYTEYGDAESFFERFNVSLMTPGRVPLVTTYADFESGETLEGVVPPLPADTTAALRKYLEVLEKYEHLILPSYENFPTENVPEDLIMPFRDFLTKYGLEAAVGRIFQVTGLGMGDMLDQPAMYAMQAFGAPITRSFVGLAGSFVSSSGRNQQLYDNIAAVLGGDVLYTSTVTETKRDENGVTLRVKTAGSSSQTIIHAKRLLVSFQPTLDKMEGFDLDEAETDVFSKWLWSTVYVGIGKNPALPTGGSLTNTPQAALPNNWLEVPADEFVGRFDWMGGENFRVLVTGNETTQTCDAQRLVQQTFQKLAAAGTVSSTKESPHVQLAAWSNHGPMHLHVSAEELASGFIGRKYALQGHLSTFYTGAAWSAQFSTILWEFNNQYVLPKLLASLE